MALADKMIDSRPDRVLLPVQSPPAIQEAASPVVVQDNWTALPAITDVLSVVNETATGSGSGSGIGSGIGTGSGSGSGTGSGTGTGTGSGSGGRTLTLICFLLRPPGPLQTSLNRTDLTSGPNVSDPWVFTLDFLAWRDLAQHRVAL